MCQGLAFVMKKDIFCQFECNIGTLTKQPVPFPQHFLAAQKSNNSESGRAGPSTCRQILLQILQLQIQINKNKLTK